MNSNEARLAILKGNSSVLFMHLGLDCGSLDSCFALWIYMLGIGTYSLSAWTYISDYRITCEASGLTVCIAELMYCVLVPNMA